LKTTAFIENKAPEGLKKEQRLSEKGKRAHMYRKSAAGLVPDDFAHEHSLVISSHWIPQYIHTRRKAARGKLAWAKALNSA